MKLYFSFLFMLACSAPMIAQSGAYATMMQSYQGEEISLIQADENVTEAYTAYANTVQAVAQKPGYGQNVDPINWMTNTVPVLIVTQNQGIKEWVSAFGEAYELSNTEQRNIRKELRKLTKAYRKYMAKQYQSGDGNAPVPPPPLPAPQMHN